MRMGKKKRGRIEQELEKEKGMRRHKGKGEKWANQKKDERKIEKIVIRVKSTKRIEKERWRGKGG